MGLQVTGEDSADGGDNTVVTRRGEKAKLERSAVFPGCVGLDVWGSDKTGGLSPKHAKDRESL